ncbi:heat shock protein Hsp20 [Keratinibaculum paraultunense]|uniref:Heat shock protein Hsp20 n=1 Tax=Keratinibaculum paraultunense TaxID=1278232 RepID=A0A4R3KZH0_9FIRM|nr:Hsp20/alpha crystallin family protein [Keratinibaculum paraultunense]QQY79944.1 Hsp20/alpha crystallin family protein [Keratinibaculum paraultunense]TCS91736.1 heat shock protein Hsp20 [Keratinibaculum paraultunense]
MANITRRDPVFDEGRSLLSLQRNMDKLFDELFRWSESMWPFVERGDEGYIYVDIIDKEKDIVVKANVPGFREEDINIEVAEDSLIISGKIEEDTDKKEKEKEEIRYILKERPQKMAFERVIPLGVKVMPDKAKATLKNGVLEITIPKAEATEKKTIKIEVE